jgi:hypothetical protein
VHHVERGQEVVALIAMSVQEVHGTVDEGGRARDVTEVEKRLGEQ